MENREWNIIHKFKIGEKLKCEDGEVEILYYRAKVYKKIYPIYACKVIKQVGNYKSDAVIEVAECSLSY